jgi:hypothetical protein
MLANKHKPRHRWVKRNGVWPPKEWFLTLRCHCITMCSPPSLGKDLILLSASERIAVGRPAGVSFTSPRSFEVAKAKEYPGKDYDFVAVFDCLHDMGDPVGTAVHVRESLGKDGTWMIVEPFASDELKDNLTPVGRVYYSFSTLRCTPCSRSQEVGLCLGAQSGEARMRQVISSAGFSRFRRATETPFNIVYEARP